jgi:hypothetical protein
MMHNLLPFSLFMLPALAQAFVGPTPEVIYPQEALDNCVEGWVQLSYDFNEDNKASDIRVVDSEPTGIFEEAAISALSAFIFSDDQLSYNENRSYVFSFLLEESSEVCLQKKAERSQNE